MPARRGEITDLTWRKAAVTLRNTRNLFAREHPLSIFQAVFISAASLAGWPKPPAWFFHPARQALGACIRKGFDYHLELIFPRQSPSEIADFLSALAGHLANPENNFLLVSHTPPQVRDLAALEREQPMPPRPRELCLDFLTPFPFSLPEKAKRWQPAPDTMPRAFGKRLRALFGVDLTGLESPWHGVGILPYFWEYIEHRHRSKSGRGVQLINGTVGPLYLKGELTPLWPLLLLGSELHLGRRLSCGQGFYRLETGRPFFDTLLAEPEPYERAWHFFSTDSDSADELPDFARDPVAQCLALRDQVMEGNYRPEPARGFPLAKKSGGERLIAEHPARDLLVQRAMLEALNPVCDRMLEDASVGFRRGRSRRTAFAMISQAAAQGFTWAVETDIARCFDEIDWDLLQAQLERKLPSSDTVLQGLLRGFIRCPLEVKGKRVERRQGLLQGSPLSPLLANLYLDAFDEELEAKGYRLIRYADDILVLVRSREEGERALADLAAALAPLRLDLKREKTAIRPLGAGVTFLGADLGQELEERGLDRGLSRKTLFLREQHAFLALDHGSLVVRKEGRALARVPLRRVDEIVIFGNVGISIRLIHRCSKDNIPISFCSPLGFYVNTLRPDSKAHFRLAGLHAARHAGLKASEALALARSLVAAKVANYAAWIQTMRAPQAKETAGRLAEAKARAEAAPSIEALRGVEAEAAKTAFGFLNSQVSQPEFKSPRRARRKQADPYNALLDFAYFLLFCQTNVMVRGLGLNPYLGVLHSHKDNYESLVSDLMEPFRHRMDRLVLRAVNLGIIKLKDLEPHPHGGWRVAHEALPRFLEAFAREMALWLVGEPAALRELLAAQVAAVAQWVRGEKFRVLDLSHPDCGGLPGPAD